MPIGTRHDATKVLLGAALCPAHQMTVESVPGSIAAGFGVRRNTTTGAYQVAASGAGPLLGVSLGPSLGNSGCFSLCYKAPKVVLRLAAIEPAVGSQVFINDTTGAANANASGGVATAAVYEKVLFAGSGGGVDESTGAAVKVAIINMTEGL